MREDSNSEFWSLHTASLNVLLNGQWLDASSIYALCRCSNKLYISIISSNRIAIVFRIWKRELMLWHSFMVAVRSAIVSQRGGMRFYCPPISGELTANDGQENLTLVLNYLIIKIPRL